MGDPLRDRRVSLAPLGVRPGVAASSVEPTYAGFAPPKASHPPTTVPPSPRTLGPRRPTLPGAEFAVVPRRRS